MAHSLYPLFFSCFAAAHPSLRGAVSNELTVYRNHKLVSPREQINLLA